MSAEYVLGALCMVTLLWLPLDEGASAASLLLAALLDAFRTTTWLISLY